MHSNNSDCGGSKIKSNVVLKAWEPSPKLSLILNENVLILDHYLKNYVILDKTV